MKKQVSFFLTALIVINLVLISLFSTSGAVLDASKIYVEIGDAIYEVEYGEIVTYEYVIKYDKELISTIDTRIEYPSQALKFNPVHLCYSDMD